MGESAYYEYTLLVDSRDSTVTDSPWNRIKVSLEDFDTGTLRNVTEIEVLALCFPKIANEHCVYMTIQELQEHSPLVSVSDPTRRRAGYVFYFDNYNLPPGKVKPMKGGDFIKKVTKFQPSLGHLNHLTIDFFKHGGGITEEDISGGVGDETPHVNILFKITCQSR